jgi:hypothetical protein
MRLPVTSAPVRPRRRGGSTRSLFAVSAVSAIGAGLLWAAAPSAIVAAAPHHAAHVAACTPAHVSATLFLTPVGGDSSSLAGAVVYTDTSGAPCTLSGIPTVHAVNPNGQALSASQAPAAPHQAKAVTLHPAGEGKEPDAATSITWSNWGCPRNSFALQVRFRGWHGSLTVPWGATTGYTGPACDGQQATLYVSPAVRAAPATAGDATAAPSS